MESVWTVSKLSTKSVGSHRELVANSCSHRRRRHNKTRHDKTVSSHRRCVLGITQLSTDVDLAIIYDFGSSASKKISKMMTNMSHEQLHYVPGLTSANLLTKQSQHHKLNTEGERLLFLLY